jgi:hypothetical protein
MRRAASSCRRALSGSPLGVRPRCSRPSGRCQRERGCRRSRGGRQAMCLESLSWSPWQASFAGCPLFFSRPGGPRAQAFAASEGWQLPIKPLGPAPAQTAAICSRVGPEDAYFSSACLRAAPERDAGRVGEPASTFPPRSTRASVSGSRLSSTTSAVPTRSPNKSGPPSRPQSRRSTASSPQRDSYKTNRRPTSRRRLHAPRPPQRPFAPSASH